MLWEKKIENIKRKTKQFAQKPFKRIQVKYRNNNILMLVLFEWVYC